ncbi:hypothetical protein HK099_001450 [Clydaea vesicula]|uniref:Uncharacterized protein n=1 Tax=Clydaea vesicula TaxID=447962 RepID=A0AAD5XVZ6_9FUNG|nr:hypothetical protein HK099_001450 [Clydaea vesicula]
MIQFVRVWYGYLSGDLVPSSVDDSIGDSNVGESPSDLLHSISIGLIVLIIGSDCTDVGDPGYIPLNSA